MKRALLILFLVTVAIALLAAPAIAKGGSAGNQNPSESLNGNQNQNQNQSQNQGEGNHHQYQQRSGYAYQERHRHCADELLLVEKNPTGDWDIIPDGDNGTLSYILSNSGHVVGTFESSDLDPGESYDLIYYNDPWPGTESVLIATVTADPIGYVSVDVNFFFPAAGDNYGGVEGYKVWLVKAEDYDEGINQMVSWNPTEYLFEYDIIPAP